MCVIGTIKKTIIVPENKPLLGYKQFNRNSFDPPEFLRPLHFPNTYFTEVFSHRTTAVYRKNISFSTVKPTGRIGSYSKGNGRGFWAYKSKGVYCRKVLLWGRVVVHDKGYRAQYMKIIS